MVASESLTRVVLSLPDVAGALALSDAAGWNQTAEDWAQFIGRGHVLGCRSSAGELVATGAALPYGGGQGWVSMVLVTPAWRHRGLATELLQGCVAFLQAAALTPVLDATPAGAPVYRRLGFAPGIEFERWEAALPNLGRAASTAGTRDANRPAGPGDLDAIRPAGPAELDAIAALDASASRVDRRFLLQAFLARPDSRAWITGAGDGFVIVRAGRRATQIGPLVAADERGAIALLGAALAPLRGAAFLDVPTRWTRVTAWLQAQGFARQRPFTRMALGPAAALHGSERLFVVAGPEFG